MQNHANFLTARRVRHSGIVYIDTEESRMRDDGARKHSRGWL